MDMTGDGKITPLRFDPEQIPIKGPKLPKEDRFKALDADKDGKLSFDEFYKING